MSLPQSANRSIYLMLFLVVAIWGLNLVIIKYLVQYFSPFALAAIRIPIAASFLLPVAVKRYGWLNLNREGWLLTGGVALCSIFLHQLTLSTGLAATSGAHSSLILGLNPLFTTVLASCFAQEPLSWNKGLGVVLGLSGVLVVVTNTADAGAATLYGDIIMLFSMFAYVAGSLFVKRSAQVVPTIVVTAYSHAIAAVALLPVAYLTEPVWIKNDIWQFTPIALILLSAWVCTGFGAYCWNMAVSRVGASVASLFLNMIPIVGLLAFALILGETLIWTHFAALVLVLAGVTLGSGIISLPGRACTEGE